MAGKPIATVGSMHVCPMVTGYIPHIGGPVSGPGAPNVLINGKPAALMGDMCVCVGPPDTVAQGEPTVLINGTPVATMGSMTAHGGSITVGEPTVMVGSATPGAKASLPLREIPFPTIRIIDRVGAVARGKSSQLREAEENQEQVREEAKKHGFLPDITFSH
ncbi:PAAR domain-containing protein [Saccharicrinis fermentans]|uniref:PAAR domain-containing protein n=1 Tax=Saccharicrinis fermentans TaxID=982 RepID=UPI00048018BE|nr:PAAR domain-containing protein [Saccharicrinis fermentans]